VELKTSQKGVRLDQLTEELRALPGMSDLQGLSARTLSATGETEITVHTAGRVLSDNEERAVREALSRHVPDPQWHASADERELATILSRSEGSLDVADLERAVRALARVVGLDRSEMITAQESGAQ
jgi:hypothetical protein